MPKEKNLEELLSQDLVQVLKSNGQPQEVIEKEINNGLEDKSLVATLKQWGSLPEVQAALKNMLVDSIETRALGPDIMAVTIWMGSTEGIACIRKVKQDVEEFKNSLKGGNYGKDGTAHA